jgi:asparagine synthase (glutamine-hydrolysing)
MCGIAGILSLNRHPIDAAAIRKMTKAMSHRGPDAEGFYEDADLALGHLRLSIIDLSDAANQPFTDSSGRYILVFNGEMYNYREVKAKLPDYPFRTSSDTEVLIAAYATWGPDCLRHFRGMFAFAIWDLRTKELFLARDRMGVKPLYYYKDDKRLIFSSETRAMLETDLVERRLGREALIDYFSYQSVSAPYTMIEGVIQVDAGSWIKIREGKMEKKVYWNVTKTADFDYADQEGVQREIRRLMLGSIERRLVSDVPVGAFLSGGIAAKYLYRGF